MATASELDEEIINPLRLTTLESYLFLPDNPFSDLPSFKANYMIYLPPMNSSGDIYHIITYLMLSKIKNKKLPDIQLSYDGTTTEESQEGKMNSFSQTLRCIRFAKHLRFGNQFISPIAFGEGDYRPNARSNKILNHFKEQHDENENICYIEQKLLTTLISNYFVEYGRDHTVEILNKLYANWSVNEEIDPKIRQSIKQTIKDMPRQKPLIILQHRFSSKANKNQNIPELEILIRLEKYLKSKGFATWYLFVDSRVRKPPTIGQIKNKTNCFPHEIDSVDYGKLFHLEFLLQVLKMENLIGIIGNTSGCLDLAAFIGHKVLNLHQFYNKFNYQSYRIFLQSSFLTIENLNGDGIKNALLDKKRHWIGFTNDIMNKNMPIAATWINPTQKTPTFPVNLLELVEGMNMDKQGFNDLHQIKIFQGGELKKRKIFIYYVLTYYIFLYFVTFFLLSR